MIRRKLYKALAGLLGPLVGSTTTGCPVAAEYGMPNADYDLSGDVVDEVTGEPIPGIQVSFNGGSYTTLTGEDGTFSLLAQGVYPCDTDCALEATDVDGATNGEYAASTAAFTPTQTAEGDGSWYEGAYEASGIRIAMPQAAPSE